MWRPFWGMVIGLIGVFAVVQVLSFHRKSANAVIAARNDRWVSERQMPMPRSGPQLPPAYAQQPRRSRPWWKPDPPAPVEPEPHWQATIEHVRVLALPNSENDVFQKVCQRLKDDLGLRILPPATFAANQAWVGVPEKVEDAVQKDAEIGKFVHVRYQFELTPDGWRELGRLDRADLAESRLVWAARGLGLFMVLLGAIAAYVRLDEWTKGYFSGRLFLAASLLVTGLGYAIMTVG